jgi:hypothetical protein
MIKATISISLFTMLITLNTWAQEEKYLEGISILGKAKTAYFVIDGHNISVHEGDEIQLTDNEAQSLWQVVRIKQNSVLLKTKAGITKTFYLNSRVSEDSQKTVENSPQEEVTPSDELPPKYRTIQTPFGYFTLSEDTSLSPSPPFSDKPGLSENEVPPGHHIVRTPFGNFIVKDKE